VTGGRSAPADTASRSRCYVELLGPARLAGGVKALALDIRGAITIAELLSRLATACPALVGSVLDPERGVLVEGHILNRNGRDFLKDPADVICPGDRLLLMSSSAGG
jgi:hypothetical protein